MCDHELMQSRSLESQNTVRSSNFNMESDENISNIMWQLTVNGNVREQKYISRDLGGISIVW
jgi:hypothetical protein